MIALVDFGYESSDKFTHFLTSCSLTIVLMMTISLQLSVQGEIILQSVCSLNTAKLFMLVAVLL